LRWEFVIAWAVAALCSLLALRLWRGLRRSNAPLPSALLNELLAEVGADSADAEWVRRAAVAELNRRLSDVAFELGSLPARFTALTRICLASGTALALIGYIGASGNQGDQNAGEPTPLARVIELVVCAAGGLVGALCVATIGRMAKQRSTEIRQEWDRASRETGKALGTSLEAPTRSGASKQGDREEGGPTAGRHESRRL
jgi:hypothetical protein